jgi:hypothetical protein
MLSHLFVPEAIPELEIERAFQALRLATGFELGYAEIYVRPIGWAWNYTAHLPPVIDPTVVRRYPPSFNEFAWNRAPARLTVEHIHRTEELLAALATGDPRMALAARRFAQAQLREDTEDAVLDLCIALEACLGDKGRSEMTHKIAMRAAALLGSNELDPVQIKARVKALYDWRSAIVHGDAAAKPIRKFAGEGASEDDAARLANILVLEALATFLLHPEIRSADDLDNVMLKSAATRLRGKDNECDQGLRGSGPVRRLGPPST